jgi:hypothetical protein
MIPNGISIAWHKDNCIDMFQWQALLLSKGHFFFKRTQLNKLISMER